MRSRLALTVFAAVLGVAPGSVSAGEKLIEPVVYNTGCSLLCPVDAIEKGTWKMLATNAAGTNGVKFKLTLSGATLGGVPVSSQILVMANLSINGGACTLYVAPQGAMANGSVRMAFTGADTSPPVPETAGALIQACDAGVLVKDYVTLATFAMPVAGIRMGDDTD